MPQLKIAISMTTLLYLPHSLSSDLISPNNHHQIVQAQTLTALRERYGQSDNDNLLAEIASATACQLTMPIAATSRTETLRILNSPEYQTVSNQIQSLYAKLERSKSKK